MSYRAIQDSSPRSDTLGELSHFSERLFWRMLAVTDTWGRLLGEPSKIRTTCLPNLAWMQTATVEAALESLISVGRIVIYSSRGSPLVCQLVDFDRHQPSAVIGRRGPSIFPAPPPEALEAAQEASSAIHRLHDANRLVRTHARARLRTTAHDQTGLDAHAWGSAGDRDLSSVSSNDLPLEGDQEQHSGDFGIDQVQLVYDHWREARGKTNARYDTISPARRQKIEARLREFSAAELTQALDAVALDPWEDRPRHDDLTKLFRSREAVDRWLELAENPPRRLPEQGSRTAGLSAEEIYTFYDEPATA